MTDTETFNFGPHAMRGYTIRPYPSFIEKRHAAREKTVKDFMDNFDPTCEYLIIGDVHPNALVSMGIVPAKTAVFSHPMLRLEDIKWCLSNEKGSGIVQRETVGKHRYRRVLIIAGSASVPIMPWTEQDIEAKISLIGAIRRISENHWGHTTVWTIPMLSAEGHRLLDAPSVQRFNARAVEIGIATYPMNGVSVDGNYDAWLQFDPWYDYSDTIRMGYRGMVKMIPCIENALFKYDSKKKPLVKEKKKVVVDPFNATNRKVVVSRQVTAPVSYAAMVGM